MKKPAALLGIILLSLTVTLKVKAASMTCEDRIICQVTCFTSAIIGNPLPPAQGTDLVEILKNLQGQCKSLNGRVAILYSADYKSLATGLNSCYRLSDIPSKK